MINCQKRIPSLGLSSPPSMNSTTGWSSISVGGAFSYGFRLGVRLMIETGVPIAKRKNITHSGGIDHAARKS